MGDSLSYLDNLLLKANGQDMVPRVLKIKKST